MSCPISFWGGEEKKTIYLAAHNLGLPPAQWFDENRHQRRHLLHKRLFAVQDLCGDCRVVVDASSSSGWLKSVTRSVSLSVIKSINQPINQPVNQSINQSVNQSNQSENGAPSIPQQYNRRRPHVPSDSNTHDTPPPTKNTPIPTSFATASRRLPLDRGDSGCCCCCSAAPSPTAVEAGCLGLSAIGQGASEPRITFVPPRCLGLVIDCGGLQVYRCAWWRAGVVCVCACACASQPYNR
jgi:hypothetical protein